MYAKCCVQQQTDRTVKYDTALNYHMNFKCEQKGGRDQKMDTKDALDTPQP